MNFWRNKKGISLVEILIVSGMMGGVALMMAKLGKDQAVYQKTAEKGTTISMLVNRAYLSLGNSETCKTALGSGAYSVGATPQLIGSWGTGIANGSIPTLVSGAFLPLYQPTQRYTGVEYNGTTVSRTASDEVTFNLSFSKEISTATKRTTIGSRDRVFAVVIKASFNPDNTVFECSGLDSTVIDNATEEVCVRSLQGEWEATTSICRNIIIETGTGPNAITAAGDISATDITATDTLVTTKINRLNTDIVDLNGNLNTTANTTVGGRLYTTLINQNPGDSVTVAGNITTDTALVTNRLTVTNVNNNPGDDVNVIGGVNAHRANLANLLIVPRINTNPGDTVTISGTAIANALQSDTLLVNGNANVGGLLTVPTVRGPSSTLTVQGSLSTTDLVIGNEFRSVANKYCNIDGTQCLDVSQVACAPNQYMQGIDSNGQAVCITLASADCGPGQYVSKVNADGSYECDTVTPSTQGSVGPNQFLMGYNSVGSKLIGTFPICPTGSSLAGTNPDGSPDCRLVPTCTSTEILVGINPDGSANCKNFPTCPTGDYLAGVAPDYSADCRPVPNCAPNNILVGINPDGSANCEAFPSCGPGSYLTGVSGAYAPVCEPLPLCSPTEVLIGVNPDGSANCRAEDSLIVGGVKDEQCGPNQYMRGFDASGNGVCVTLASADCGPGQYVSKVNPDGSYTCDTVTPSTQGTVGPNQYLIGYDAVGSKIAGTFPLCGSGRFLAGTNPDGSANCRTLPLCGATQVLIGVNPDGSANCRAETALIVGGVKNKKCAVGQVMEGFDNSGNLICVSPPPPPAPAITSEYSYSNGGTGSTSIGAHDICFITGFTKNALDSGSNADFGCRVTKSGANWTLAIPMSFRINTVVCYARCIDF